MQSNETINAKRYCRKLEELLKNLKDKRPSLVNRTGVLLLHDNARTHIAKQTQAKILEFDMEVLSDPPYLPNLVPSDYHLFRSLQHFLDGKRFITKDDEKTNIESFFSSQLEDLYSRGINSLPDRWNYVIKNNGTYLLD